jgi:hypothetical protein
MNLQKAIEILEYHQQWRLGNEEEMKYTSKELTKAISVVLNVAKNVLNVGLS